MPGERFEEILEEDEEMIEQEYPWNADMERFPPGYEYSNIVLGVYVRMSRDEDGRWLASIFIPMDHRLYDNIDLPDLIEQEFGEDFFAVNRADNIIEFIPGGLSPLRHVEGTPIRSFYSTFDDVHIYVRDCIEWMNTF